MGVDPTWKPVVRHEIHMSVEPLTDTMKVVCGFARGALPVRIPVFDRGEVFVGERLGVVPLRDLVPFLDRVVRRPRQRAA